jgi:hypothetical protein
MISLLFPELAHLDDLLGVDSGKMNGSVLEVPNDLGRADGECAVSGRSVVTCIGRSYGESVW